MAKFTIEINDQHFPPKAVKWFRPIDGMEISLFSEYATWKAPFVGGTYGECITVTETLDEEVVGRIVARMMESAHRTREFLEAFSPEELEEYQRAEGANDEATRERLAAVAHERVQAGIEANAA